MYWLMIAVRVVPPVSPAVIWVCFWPFIINIAWELCVFFLQKSRVWIEGCFPGNGHRWKIIWFPLVAHFPLPRQSPSRLAVSTGMGRNEISRKLKHAHGQHTLPSWIGRFRRCRNQSNGNDTFRRTVGCCHDALIFQSIIIIADQVVELLYAQGCGRKPGTINKT